MQEGQENLLDPASSTVVDSPVADAPLVDPPAVDARSADSPVVDEKVAVPHLAKTPGEPPVPQPIIAGPGRYYRNTRYIMAALTVVMGFWFGYDGFIRWPAENKQIDQIEQQLSESPGDPELRTALKNHSKHSDMDVLLQRLLAFSLPPMGVCLLLWALYNSRGEYRLANDVLSVPGHPPVPLEAIRELDESAWDRKGIARAAYTLVDSRAGTLKLDDFVYDRNPTDQIYDRIKKHLLPPAPVETAPTIAAAS